MKVEAKICGKLVVNEGVGICKLMNCICPCFDCEFADICEWQKECHKKDWKEIDDALLLYRSASRRLKDTIRNKMKQIPKKELYGGLLWRREESLLSAFTEAQGDIVDACLVNKYLKDAPVLSADDVCPTDRTAELCHLITFKHILDSYAYRISQHDLILFATEEGINSLHILADRPFDAMKERIDTMTKMKKGKLTESEIPTENPKKAWALKMVDSYRWCKKNRVPICFEQIRNDKEFRAIQNHMGDIGKEFKGKKKLTLDKKVCFELSYPLYESLIYVFRHLYARFPAIRKTISLLQEKKTNPHFAFGSLAIEDWDRLVMDAFLRQVSEDFTFNFSAPEKADWPLSVNNGSFWATMLMMGFIQRNLSEVAIKFSERGWVFESKLRTELRDRGVTILRKNLETPFGDVDFICETEEKLLAVEAKDYKPWYDRWYVSSRVFEKRRKKLETKLSRLPSRINWINANRKVLRLPKDVEPLLISKYEESNIGVRCLILDKLDSVFGSSKFPKYSETLPKYVASDDGLQVQIMGKNLHFPPPVIARASLKTSSGRDMILRPCSKYPECMCVHLDDNPWLLKNKGELPKLCKSLRTMTGGGPCPDFRAFCMWAGFCARSLDPTPFVKELRRRGNEGFEST
jgi:Holliday junction resolvase-like predicted endonuclease